MRDTWRIVLSALCLVLLAAAARTVAADPDAGPPPVPPAAGTEAGEEGVTAASPTEEPGKDETDDPGGIVGVFRRGGVMMWALLAASCVALTFTFERAVDLRRSVHLPRELVAAVKSGREDEIVRWLDRDAGRTAALARVLRRLMVRRDARREELERVLEDESERTLWDMRLNIRPVHVVSALAPLLGLLGTVLGLIAAFRTAAERGMDDPANFAAGIYQALYTTAFGLAVAIPFLIAMNYLRAKADVIAREVEELVLQHVVARVPERPAGRAPAADAA